MAVIDLAARKEVLLFGNRKDLWSTTFGEWQLWVNASSYDNKRLDGTIVPPATAYVTYKRAPIAFLNHQGGAFAPMGAATEDAFLAAIRGS